MMSVQEALKNKGSVCRRQYYLRFRRGKAQEVPVLSGSVAEEALYEETLKKKADIYIIMLGTNDSKIINWNADDYKKQLGKFVESYQNANKNARIYLMQPPRCFPDKITGRVRYTIQNEHIEDEIYKSVEETGWERGVGVIDLYHLTENHPEWFKDGIHPNAAGYEKIADYIYEAIMKDR